MILLELQKKDIKIQFTIYGIDLLKSGDIYLSKYKGWYSVSDEAYYNEDEIIEKDGKKYLHFQVLLVEWVEEESFFFKLSAWEKKLLDFYEKNQKFILTSF